MFDKKGTPVKTGVGT